MSERSPSEQLPSREEEPKYGEKTLREWHEHLTTQDGEPAGHLATPGSRYGSTAHDCAWWAVAALVAYNQANGSDDNDQLIEELMSLAVNDSEGLAEVVREYQAAVPPWLADELGLQEASGEAETLDEAIKRKFVRYSDSALIDRMERSEDFNYDDEEYELNRRLKLGGLTWRWVQIEGRDRVEVYRLESSAPVGGGDA